VSTNFA